MVAQAGVDCNPRKLTCKYDVIFNKVAITALNPHRVFDIAACNPGARCIYLALAVNPKANPKPNLNVSLDLMVVLIKRCTVASTLQ